MKTRKETYIIKVKDKPTRKAWAIKPVTRVKQSKKKYTRNQERKTFMDEKFRGL